MDFLLSHGRLAAIAAVFFAGVTVRRLEWAGEPLARRLLSFVFYVALPILIFGALAGAPLSRQHALLPVLAVTAMLVAWGAAALLARRWSLSRRSAGSLALCAMSMNISMIYPFASLTLAPAAFAELVTFDMGHAVMAWTFTTVLACKYGGHPDDIPVLLARTLASPPLWVLALALTLNLTATPLPAELLHGALRVGQVCVLLVPFAMGLLVTSRGLRRREVWGAVLMRSLLGVSLGVALAWLFGLEGTAAHVAVLGASAPIGFTAVVLTARESLDVELTASAAAISVFAGALWIPLAVTFV